MTKAQEKLAAAIDSKMGLFGVRTDMHLDRQGRGITTGQWSALFNDRRYQVVKQTTTKSGYWVSTVWIGMSNFFGAYNFETMVWGRNHSGPCHYQNRYATEAEALAGHKATVEKFKRAPKLRVVRKR